MYDFAAKRLRVFDLDHYSLGPCRNTMGRMFGSTRFMPCRTVGEYREILVPEEFEKGRLIDERTTVFALGRTMTIFLGAAASTVARTACAEDPARRHPTVAALAADFAATAGRLRC